MIATEEVPAESALVRIGNGIASAVVSRHGGQLLSWKCSGRERVYLSPKACFSPGKAIRGGVPVIFPQFAERGDGPRHGFARLREWRVQPDGNGDAAWMSLTDDESTRRAWPHSFKADLRVELIGAALTIGLEVTNTGTSAASFAAALHTYLRVDSLSRVGLRGLEGREFQDSTAGGALARESDALRFAGEVDRIYPDVDGPVFLDDGEQCLRIDQEGFRDIVVWNPGARLAAGLSDLGAGEHDRFVCVEAATILSPVHLPPGAIWRGVQRLSALD